MDVDKLKESSDEQDEQDDQEDQDDIQSTVNTPKDTIITENENRLENLSNASCKSQDRISNNSKSRSPQKVFRTINHFNQAKRSWRSANAFINFVQDFKQDNPDLVLGRNIFQICGEKWKSMSDEEKQPYIIAANSVKKLKKRKIGEVSDQPIKKSVTRVSKRKADTKRKETSQKRSKAHIRQPKSNSDTDTATTSVHSAMNDAGSL